MPRYTVTVAPPDGRYAVADAACSGALFSTRHPTEAEAQAFADRANAIEDGAEPPLRPAPVPSRNLWAEGIEEGIRRALKVVEGVEVLEDEHAPGTRNFIAAEVRALLEK